MHNLRKGSEGEHVEELQSALSELGFTVDVNGDFDDATHHAVIALQTIFGYDVDGIVGPATHKLIEKQRELGWNLTAARDNGYSK